MDGRLRLSGVNMTNSWPRASVPNDPGRLIKWGEPRPLFVQGDSKWSVDGRIDLPSPLPSLHHLRFSVSLQAPDLGLNFRSNSPSLPALPHRLSSPRRNPSAYPTSTDRSFSLFSHQPPLCPAVRDVHQWREGGGTRVGNAEVGFCLPSYPHATTMIGKHMSRHENMR